MTSLLVLALLVAEVSRGESTVLCNGGDGAPFWAHSMQDCLARARNQAGNDAREIANQAEQAEKRARDARKIGDQLAADRREAERRNPEGLPGLGAAPYFLAGGLAGLAAGLAAQRSANGESPLPLPRTQKELLAAEDPSVVWKRYASYEAERATRLYHAAAGGVEAARRFNEFSETTKRRAESMISLDRGQALVPAGSRSGIASPSEEPGKKSPGKGAAAAKADLPAGTGGEKLSAQDHGQKSPALAGTGKNDRGAVAAAGLPPPGPGFGGESSSEKNVKMAAKLEGLQKDNAKDKAKAAQADGLDLFERAMNRADEGEKMEGLAGGALPLTAPVSRESVGAESLFAKVTRQYRKRESLYFSPFGE